MTTLRHTAVAVTLLATSLVAPAAAQGYAANGAQSWSFDETTTGQDVSWSSPTSVDPAALVFNTSFELTVLDVGISWSGISFGTISALDQVPPEVQSNSAEVLGPAPIVLASESVVYPLPPEAPAVAADISIGVDATGTGFFDATNVTLGTLTVDLGFPFGVQPVTITSLRVAGTLSIHATWFDLGGALAGSSAPVAAATGSLAADSAGTAAVLGGPAGGTANLVVGLSPLGAPFKGGTLVPFPDVLFLGLPLDGFGDLTVPFTWPAGVPSRTSLYLQWWLADAGGPVGFSATNGLRGETP